MKLSTLQRVALYIFFFSINFEAWDPFNTDGNFSISKLTGFLYVSSLIPQIKYFIRIKGLKHFLNPLWLFFGLLTLISFININYLSSSFFNFSLFQNLLLFILLINHAKKEPGILEKGLIAFAFGSVVLAILFYLGIGTEYSDARVTMFGDNENVIGIRMCISIIYLFFLIIENALNLGTKRFLFLLPLPIMLSLLVATGSRVAFLSLSFSLLAGLIFLKTRKIHTKVFIIAIGIFIGIYLFNYILSSEVLYQRLVNSVGNRDLADRDIIWKSLFPLIKNNSILGVGTTGYSLFSYQAFGELTSPHNVIIEVLCYTGIVGLSIYLLFLFRILEVSFNKYRYSSAVIQLVLLIPLLGLILSGQLLTSKIAWVLFAFAIAQTSSSSPLIQNGKKRKFSV